jgi:hypothetical protein
MALTAPSANAAYGDSYSLKTINTPGFETAPAFPDATAFWAGTCDLSSTATAQGTAPGLRRHCIDWGAPNDVSEGPESWITPPSWRLAAVGDSGTRPDGTATFVIERNGDSETITYPDGSVDDIAVDLPPGFIGNPNALPKCTNAQFALKPNACPASSQVGVSNVAVKRDLNGGLVDGVYPVYNLEPREGYTAEFGIPDVAGYVPVRIVAKARTSSDFGVTAMVTQIPAALPLLQQAVTLWAVPWSSEHDEWRLKSGTTSFIPPGGLAPADQAVYTPSWGPIRPFSANITRCSGVNPSTRLMIDIFQQQGAFNAWGEPDLTTPTNWRVADSAAPLVGECEKLPFQPEAEYTAAMQPDSPLGLSADVRIPQNNQPPVAVASNPDEATGAPDYWKSDVGRAASHLDKTVVTLPEGFSVNPASAAGLQGCSDADVGVRESSTNPLLFNNGDPFNNDSGADGAECPEASIIGSARVDTPLLDDPLTGEVVLGMPKSVDPTSGAMFRMFIVVRDPARGLIAKIYGSAVANGTATGPGGTGQLVATFDKNPQVPFDSVHLEFKGGDRGLVATPTSCGGRSIASEFTPWTATDGQGGTADTVLSPVGVDGDCSRGTAISMQSGMSSLTGGGSGKFSFRLDRPDREQGLYRGLSAELPTGLLGAVKDVPLCTNAQAAGNACPPASRIGTVDAGAGAGLPFFLDRKGDAYLTEGYKGAPYGLAVSVPVEAGPFRGQFALTPIVVRQALHVDPTDASVTAVSDPLPQIWHGIPLRVRQATVKIDRLGFMRNPSDCSPKRIDASITTNEGGSVNLSQPFQATKCSQLGFKPKLAMSLTGKKQVTTGKHPGVRAVVTQTGGEAGVDKAIVRLPLSLALDPENAQALCEFADGTKPDLEKRCPKGSVVGRARAVSPLLKRPLTGDVYFVKNVRIDPGTGNQIRTLPMIVVALRGEIAVNLRGVSSTTKAGKLVNTFDAVPDAPIQQFNLNIAGGNSGILAVTRTRKVRRVNVCNSKQVAEADFDGQNGKTHDRDIKIKTPCKAKRKTAKRKSARRAG